MGTVGIDFGTQTSVIAITRRGGVDIILNEVSNRATPTMVAFGQKERFIGESAAGQQIMNFRNTIFDVKRFIGRKYAEPDIQAALRKYPFKTLELENGSVGFEVTYKGETQTYSAEKLAGAILAQLKRTTEKDTGSLFSDVVLSVPGWWSACQRASLLDAAKIAGLKCLRLLNDNTASALSYGLFKLDFSEKDPTHIMFIDIGHASMSVSIVDFYKAKLQVVSAAYDPTFGGKYFDEILTEYFGKEFVKNYKIDINENKKAKLRTESASEKLKKMLSANSDAPLNIESLMEDKDVRSRLKRSELEDLVAPLLDRVLNPVKEALAAANLQPNQLHSVEIIGGTYRIQAVQKKLEEFLGQELKKTLNSAESVAKGCALMGAILTPTVKVRDYEIVDNLAYPIKFSWIPRNQGEMEVETLVREVKAGSGIPIQVPLVLERLTPFEFKAEYDLPAAKIPGAETLIARYEVTSVPKPKGDTHSLNATYGIDLSCLPIFDGVSLVESVEVVEEPPKAAKKDTKKDEKKEGDKKEEEAKKSDDKVHEPPKKRKSVASAATVQTNIVGSLPAADLSAAVDHEGKMTADDKLSHETSEKKNDLESYVLGMKSKLNDNMSSYATSQEKESIVKLCNEIEDWLYNDGEDTTKAAYTEKSNQVHKLGDPVEARYKDFTIVFPDALHSLSIEAGKWQTLTESKDAKYEHITKEERDKVVKECQDALLYIASTTKKLNEATKTTLPPFPLSEIYGKRNALEKLGKEVMNRSKPAPPKAEPKKDEKKDAKPAAAEKKEAGAKKEATVEEPKSPEPRSPEQQQPQNDNNEDKEGSKMEVE